MSAAACKVVIDWYASLGVEAAALARDAKSIPLLSSEADALAEAAEIICDEGTKMIAYLEAETDEADAQAQIDQIVALSGQACDWAKELRIYRDAYALKAPHANEIADIVKEMRSWRDAGTGLIRTLAEAQIVAEKAAS